MTELKLSKIGNSVGLVLPKEILARLHLEAGDVVYLTESSEGVRLTPYDPTFARQMKSAERVMKRHREVFRALA